MCGEHPQAVAAGGNLVGSSPRVRGTPEMVFPFAIALGIIPACAGNTSWQSTPLRCCRDHPRVCGEHRTANVKMHVQPGSSPRVRGTPKPRCRTFRTIGIIPACAGNTTRPSTRSSRARDHPRVCGEHPGSGTTSLRREGSSPRVRGTRDNPGCALRPHGIIPACAGNTSARRVSPTAPWDHPRVCGEH